MRSEKIVEYLIYAIVVFFIVAIFLQIIYLHTKISSTQNMILKKGYKANQTAEKLATQENKFRIYSCIMQNTTMAQIFNLSDIIEDDLKKLLASNKRHIPLFCNRTIKNAEIIYEKIGILVLDKTDGALNLYNDIVNQNIHYVIINNNLFGIEIDGKINDALIKHLEKRNENMIQTINNSIVLILLPLKNYKLLHQIDDNDNCNYILHPFIGKCDKKTNIEVLLNLRNELIYEPSQASRSIIPTYIIGYRTIT